MNRLMISLGFVVAIATLAMGQSDARLRYYYPIPRAAQPRTIEVDVAVYGGTPGGVTAAVQTARMGKKAALFSFNTFVGGLTSGGLSATDFGKAASIGGMAKEFYGRAGKIEGFNPSVAERMFVEMLKEAEVGVFFERRLVEVKKTGSRITELVFENGDTVRAKVFVDATYEGDLFAMAGVSYTVGREANAVHGETYNGVHLGHPNHNFKYPVDPYVKEGDATSGLLWGISAKDPGTNGEGDGKVQAYNFRMFLSNAEDRIAYPKPEGYDASHYALLLRYLMKKPELSWSFTYADGPFQLRNGDCNNAGGFSTDYIGGNYRWPDGHDHDAQPMREASTWVVKPPKITPLELYALREKIFQDHVSYQQGLMYFMANDPSVPQKLRDRVGAFGLKAGEFATTGGWPHQLYVREGRRMVSDVVMTQAHCQGKTVAEDSVGLASYGMDSHHCARVIVKGVVKNEGNVEYRTPQPYPVSYKSIVPKESECSNLLVPVCLSSTHIAYGSIRMEPVFMILGQSAATAAVQAIDGGVAVQKVDYAKLKERLTADKQVLEWKAEK